MAQQRVFIPGPAGQLQAIYSTAPHPKAAVVICHPHPQHGGTMHNKVVFWMAKTFAHQECCVLRFNFRGVEESEGEWDDGRGEADDAVAALQWLHAKHPDTPLWLGGFSFGCYAGLKAAMKMPQVSRLFAVAPAVNLYDFSFIDNDPRPLTVIHGDKDEIVPYNAVSQWAQKRTNLNFVTIQGAGHFFPKQKQALLDALQVF
ncbi:MAG TPA: alpha/beta fold hydrolase [Gammaproteobacteria bacterium]|nr:alpha/beta fold hydrolase [Gammaproteobacteria bacterium]